MNVLIRASKDKTLHKMAFEMDDPNSTECWWNVNGTPRKCNHLDKILFSDGDKVYASGMILKVESGKIWFTPLIKVDRPNPKKPPTRGYIYF